LQSFTGKPSFHARLDIEQTVLEVQNFEMWVYLCTARSFVLWMHSWALCHFISTAL